MLTRPLPHSDLHLTVLGFGCWTVGSLGWGAPVPPDEAQAALDAAVEGGVNWLDTAPIYGEADAQVAAFRQRHPALHIATKVGVRQGHPPVSDLRPAHILADAEASLRRLGRIDLLQIHWPCEVGAALTDSLGALSQLRDRGDIRAFGLCNYDAAAIRAAAALAPLSSLQAPYSLLRREAEAAILPAAKAVGVGVLAYETLVRGLLSGRFRHPPRLPETDIRSRDPRFAGAAFAQARGLLLDLQAVADRAGLPLPALAPGWALAQPGIFAAVVGARSAAQVRAWLPAATLVDRPVVVRIIDKVAALHGGTPRRQ